MWAVRRPATTDTIATSGSALRSRCAGSRSPNPNPDAAVSTTLDQGADGGGGSRFNGLERIWWDEHRHRVFFNTTERDNAGYGQVWEYVRRRRAISGELYLRFESPGKDVLDSLDDLKVTPRLNVTHGGIVVCEDDANGGDIDTHLLAAGIESVNQLIGLDTSGGRSSSPSMASTTPSSPAPPGARRPGRSSTSSGRHPHSGMTWAMFPPAGDWGSGLV